MNIELSGTEEALLISALTCKIERLKSSCDLFTEQGMSHWVDSVEAEILACMALKERLFK